MNRKIFTPLMLLGILFIFAGPSTAGELEDGFAKKLKGLASDDMITGLVRMKEQVDLQALKMSVLVPERLPARERHEKVIRALQEMAEKTQQSLIAELDQWSKEGAVSEYTPLWILNAVAVTANKRVFYDISSRDDVAYVEGNDPVPLIKPVSSAPSTTTGRGVEPGINATNAPELWKLGIKGQGTIVCNIDTGVDGNHAAFASRWRGLDPGVAPEAAFFDPVTGYKFPTDFNGHGTHTMGTLCGDDGIGNQVGMAPEAKWIAAATIDRVSLQQTKIDAIKSFQWCADPDGNPGTDEDVPDVSSNSWGFSPLFHSVPKGDPTFWLPIDGCEAAGCIVVFAAGNEGWYGSETLRTPADRIASPVNVLAVGSVNVDQVTRTSWSSIGPSGIDHYTKKPDVMAQGDHVRSAQNGGGYFYLDGTSMACPHVGGGAALLRSAFPESTVFEVKAALLYTADDLGPAGNDNEYGMGRINMLAAYNFLKDNSLIGDSKELSITNEQIVVYLALHGGAANANRNYLMLGSASGTSPGIPLPGGQVLPLNWDVFTSMTLLLTNTTFFQNFSGTLDANGDKVAVLDIDRPAEPSTIGTVLSFAFCTMPPGGYNFTSNAWDVEITP